MSEGNDEPTTIGRWRKLRWGWWGAGDHGAVCWNIIPLLSFNYGKNAWAFQVGWLRWSWWLGRPHRKGEDQQ